MAAGERTTYTLTKGHELRLEAGAEQPISIMLTEGQAEVFGAELPLRQALTVRNQKFAVFTWEGCTLEVSGSPEVVYEADETPMSSYLQVHDVLKERRRSAQEAGGQGPRVMVVGPTDSGKSSLGKILVNYAVRSGWVPTMVDLDIGQGSITAPGCIAATPVEYPVDVEEGFPAEAPLVYFFGSVSPSDNPDLYKSIVERMAAVLNKRAAADGQVRAAGMVINTMGWIDGLGYQLLVHAMESLQADVILVVGQERLYSQLATHVRDQGMADRLSVVKVSKSGGVVERSSDVRGKARTSRVVEYFYGVGRRLSPASQAVPLSEVSIYRVGGGPRAPSSALPIGAVSKVDPLRLDLVRNPGDLLYTLLAVSHAQSPEQLLASNAAGFVYVSDVDVAKGTLTYLAPSPGPLPGKLLLAGSFKTYFD